MPVNVIYQYSLVNALMSGVSDSGITAAQLIEKGNQGLGTFVRMDGELLLLDGKVYQLQAEGQIRVADPMDQIPYAVSTYFEPQHTLNATLENKDAIDTVLERYNDHASNLFMSYRIEGLFRRLKCRTVKGQEYENQPLSELGKKQFVADYVDIEGTIIGFRSPQAWQGFFVAGEHMHFINKDKTAGGHVLELESREVRIGIATVNNIHIELPTTDKFNTAVMSTDDVGLKRSKNPFSVQSWGLEDASDGYRNPPKSPTSSNDSDQQSEHSFPPTIFEDCTVLLDCSFDTIARILSIYHGSFNPFRSSNLSTWRRSPLLLALLKFLSGTYQMNLTNKPSLCVVVNQARGNTLGQLLFDVSTINQSLPAKKVAVLLAMVMFGLSSSWYDMKDLGLAHYNAAATLLQEVHFEHTEIPSQNYRFFQESMIYWWMMLSFACDPSTQEIKTPPTLIGQCDRARRIPHPLTGISPRSQLLFGKVGYLVFSQRRKALQHSLTATGDILESLSQIEKARKLECQLLSLEIPAPSCIMDPKDPDTPIKDLVTIADAYRMCGLLLLYHAFPDLLDVRLKSDQSGETDRKYQSSVARQQWLASFAISILQMLQENNETSGTRTIEAILLLIISGELSQGGFCSSQNEGDILSRSTSSVNLNTGQSWETCPSETLVEARSVVINRFERIQAILPFKTIDLRKDEKFLNNKSKKAALPQKASQNNTCPLTNTWWPEIFGITFSTSCLIIKVYLSGYFSGDPLRRLPSGLTLKATLAILMVAPKSIFSLCGGGNNKPNVNDVGLSQVKADENALDICRSQMKPVVVTWGPVVVQRRFYATWESSLLFLTWPTSLLSRKLSAILSN
ncbi:alpha-acetolactate decarboxylase [Rhinocladiella mackenziei CBS 650.93]|uniref:Alpha-acetolactate decarboxylase n=1 Tax=Rhinocladiella mackenziei CBS 650.93 TaxID=1442369 RepID=A0A0D2FIV9_9EURO|nr:alpha-acetolactate decarboxylase [Rhinocladiella mackenziei CBS 650.93]KIX01927.1 alpha-acetolactate decarboxylase [Rhinocladiella mackenziei CBS 650.93]